MNIIVSGGGTGGHIYPALTIIRAIQQREPSARILYVGTPHGLEADIVPREGLNFIAVDLAGFERHLSFENVLRAWRAVRAVARARGIVHGFHPDIAIGTGGYVAGPILLAASLAGVPTLVQEQNAVAGVTNRILAPRCSRRRGRRARRRLTWIRRKRRCSSRAAAVERVRSTVPWSR